MDLIEQALGTDFAMFYLTEYRSDQLISVVTLQQALDECNKNIDLYGFDMSKWQVYNEYNNGPRLVRVNWIYQNLNQEPIRKPFLVHRENNQFVVDCGDTRLMSLSLLDKPVNVDLLITCRIDQIEEYPSGIRIFNSSQLIDTLNFDKASAVVLCNTVENRNQDYIINWIEVGDQTTAHHLHDDQHRAKLLQAYLRDQGIDFRFSRDWAKSGIDWDYYDKQLKA